MEFIDSKSYKNLEKAFQDEAVTVLKYTFFAAKARKEGREDIAELFEKIRTNEYEHAKMIFSNLYDDNQTLEQVLKSVTEEENFDWKYNYPELANIAKAENYPNIAELFQRIATLENAHEREFTEALLTYNDKVLHIQNIKQENTTKTKYACILCGYNSEEMPGLCPICNSDGPFITI